VERILRNKTHEKVLTATTMTKERVASLFKRANFYGVFFFTRTSGSVKLDGQEFMLENTALLFFYPYQDISFEGDYEGFFIQFHPDFFCIDIHARDIGCQGVLFNNFFNEGMLKCTPEEFDTLYTSYKNIHKELEKQRMGQLDMISSQLKILLIKAVRIKTGRQHKILSIKEQQYRQLENLITRYYNIQSSSEFYSEALGVSQTTFNRWCQKYFQNSFITLLNLKRIAVAKNKLFLTNIPIKEVAYEIGYQDPLYFSRVFKKHCSISPREFRRQLQQHRLL